MRGIDQRKAREISSFFFQINIRKKYIYQLSVLRSSSRMWWDANYVRIIISEYWKLNNSNWLFMSWNHSPRPAIERQGEKEINFVIDRFNSVQIEIPSFIIVAINQKEFGEFSLTDTRSLSLNESWRMYEEGWMKEGEKALRMCDLQIAKLLRFKNNQKSANKWMKNQHGMRMIMRVRNKKEWENTWKNLIFFV